MPGLLAGADVAIAPLDDSPFSRGKCAYKLLQDAATGLPVVGSPVGANRLALQRFAGVAVDQGGDWCDALTQVLEEPVKRRRDRGLTALAAVREHYSFEVWEASWLGATGLG
jgi:glycosyltransferase involved in cell wall biosynthesis